MAALNPVLDEPLHRMIAGAQRRGENVVIVSEVPDPTRDYWRTWSSGVSFANDEGVQGRLLPARVEANVAQGLQSFEADLSGRILSTHGEAEPWFALHQWRTGMSLDEAEAQGALGTFRPILVNDLNETVAGVWSHEDHPARWFVIPPGCDWSSVLQWVVDRAIPELVPQAARRVGLLAWVPENFRTPEERRAEEALFQFRDDASRRERRLEEALTLAKQRADEIRLPLLEQRGHTLKRAVASLLQTAGFSVEDLDETMGEGVSTDLLVSDGDKHWLVEVTSTLRAPRHREIDDLRRHLRRWEAFKRSESIEHGVLMVSSHLGEPPDRRPYTPYTDQALIDSLDVAVVSTVLLFKCWLANATDPIRRSITDPPGQRTGELLNEA